MEQFGPILERIEEDVWWVVAGFVLLPVLLLLGVAASVLRRMSRLRRQRHRLRQLSIMLDALRERAAAVQRRAREVAAAGDRPRAGSPGVGAGRQPS